MLSTYFGLLYCLMNSSLQNTQTKPLSLWRNRRTYYKYTFFKAYLSKVLRTLFDFKFNRNVFLDTCYDYEDFAKSL